MKAFFRKKYFYTVVNTVRMIIVSLKMFRRQYRYNQLIRRSHPSKKQNSIPISHNP